MSGSIEEIRNYLDDELTEFEKRFRQELKSDVFLLDKITQFMVKRKGKQMRPMFVFLSARISGGLSDSAYTAATLIELLHTATLVHDDVVDDAYERRGAFSINGLWRNKIAVLVGDFLLSKGLLTSVDRNEYELLKIVSTAVKEMSEGELLQLEKARKLDITEEVYFEIIRKKTASLIASCCACGSYSTSRNSELTEKMRQFGEYVGIAFQIKDDILDYGKINVGKPRGIDIKEQKMTLPLIYTLNNSTRERKRKIINTVKKYNTDLDKVKELIEMVHHSGGIVHAEKVMDEYIAKAMSILKTFPESEDREMMAKLVQFSIQREK